MYTVPLLENCPFCDGYCQVVTPLDFLMLNVESCNNGDYIFCTKCNCSGNVNRVSSIDVSIKWNEICDQCLDSFESTLDSLVEKVMAVLNRHGVHTEKDTLNV